MEGVVQCAWMPPSPTKREPLPFFRGSSQAFANRLANQSGLQRDKDDGEGSKGGERGRWWRRMTCQMRKKTYWKGQSGREKKHIEPMEKCNLLTIWLGGWQQPSSVFLELYNTPNYSVRKIKESQRAVEWKKKSKVVPEGTVDKLCSITLLCL